MEEFYIVPFEQRRSYVNKLMTKYPDTVPSIICRYTVDINDTDKKIYILPNKLSVRQLIKKIKDRSKTDEQIAIYLIAETIDVNKNKCHTLLSATQTMKDIYAKCAAADGFLYIFYNKEQTFG